MVDFKDNIPPWKSVGVHNVLQKLQKTVLSVIMISHRPLVVKKKKKWEQDTQTDLQISFFSVFSVSQSVSMATVNIHMFQMVWLLAPLTRESDLNI